MSEIEKAIEDIKNNRYTDHGVAKKSIDLAILALEKQMSVKLTDTIKNTAGNSGGYLASCPTCHHHILVYIKECHCDKCGQRVRLECGIDD